MVPRVVRPASRIPALAAIAVLLLLLGSGCIEDNSAYGCCVKADAELGKCTMFNGTDNVKAFWNAQTKGCNVAGEDTTGKIPLGTCNVTKPTLDSTGTPNGAKTGPAPSGTGTVELTINVPVCTDRAPTRCQQPSCNIMACGPNAYNPTPLPSSGDMGRDATYGAQGKQTGMSTGGGTKDKEPIVNLYGAQCKFYPMDERLAQMMENDKGSFVNTFRLGVGGSFSDYENAKYFFPMTDKLCSPVSKYYTTTAKDRYMNYLVYDPTVLTLCPVAQIICAQTYAVPPGKNPEEMFSAGSCAETGATMPPQLSLSALGGKTGLYKTTSYYTGVSGSSWLGFTSVAQATLGGLLSQSGKNPNPFSQEKYNGKPDVTFVLFNYDDKSFFGTNADIQGIVEGTANEKGDMYFVSERTNIDRSFYKNALQWLYLYPDILARNGSARFECTQSDCYSGYCDTQNYKRAVCKNAKTGKDALCMCEKKIDDQGNTQVICDGLTNIYRGVSPKDGLQETPTPVIFQTGYGWGKKGDAPTYARAELTSPSKYPYKTQGGFDNAGYYRESMGLQYQTDTFSEWEKYDDMYDGVMGFDSNDCLGSPVCYFQADWYAWSSGKSLTYVPESIDCTATSGNKCTTWAESGERVGQDVSRTLFWGEVRKWTEEPPKLGGTLPANWFTTSHDMEYIGYSTMHPDSFRGSGTTSKNMLSSECNLKEGTDFDVFTTADLAKIDEDEKVLSKTYTGYIYDPYAGGWGSGTYTDSIKPTIYGTDATTNSGFPLLADLIGEDVYPSKSPGQQAVYRHPSIGNGETDIPGRTSPWVYAYYGENGYAGSTFQTLISKYIVMLKRHKDTTSGKYRFGDCELESGTDGLDSIPKIEEYGWCEACSYSTLAWQEVKRGMKYAPLATAAKADVEGNTAGATQDEWKAVCAVKDQPVETLESQPYYYTESANCSKQTSEFPGGSAGSYETWPATYPEMTYLQTKTSEYLKQGVMPVLDLSDNSNWHDTDKHAFYWIDNSGEFVDGIPAGTYTPMNTCSGGSLTEWTDGSYKCCGSDGSCYSPVVVPSPLQRRFTYGKTVDGQVYWTPPYRYPVPSDLRYLLKDKGPLIVVVGSQSSWDLGGTDRSEQLYTKLYGITMEPSKTLSLRARTVKAVCPRCLTAMKVDTSPEGIQWLNKITADPESSVELSDGRMMSYFLTAPTRQDGYLDALDGIFNRKSGSCYDLGTSCDPSLISSIDIIVSDFYPQEIVNDQKRKYVDLYVDPNGAECTPQYVIDKDATPGGNRTYYFQDAPSGGGSWGCSGFCESAIYYQGNAPDKIFSTYWKTDDYTSWLNFNPDVTTGTECECRRAAASESASAYTITDDNGASESVICRLSDTPQGDAGAACTKDDRQFRSVVLNLTDYTRTILYRFRKPSLILMGMQENKTASKKTVTFKVGRKLYGGRDIVYLYDQMIPYARVQCDEKNVLDTNAPAGIKVTSAFARIRGQDGRADDDYRDLYRAMHLCDKPSTGQYDYSGNLITWNMWVQYVQDELSVEMPIGTKLEKAEVRVNKVWGQVGLFAPDPKDTTATKVKYYLEGNAAKLGYCQDNKWTAASDPKLTSTSPYAFYKDTDYGTSTGWIDLGESTDGKMKYDGTSNDNSFTISSMVSTVNAKNGIKDEPDWRQYGTSVGNNPCSAGYEYEIRITYSDPDDQGYEGGRASWGDECWGRKKDSKGETLYDSYTGFYSYMFAHQDQLVKAGILGVIYKSYEGMPGSDAVAYPESGSLSRGAHFCGMQKGSEYLIREKPSYIYQKIYAAPKVACVQCTDYEVRIGKCSPTCANGVSCSLSSSSLEGAAQAEFAEKAGDAEAHLADFTYVVADKTKADFGKIDANAYQVEGFAYTSGYYIVSGLFLKNVKCPDLMIPEPCTRCEKSSQNLLCDITYMNGSMKHEDAYGVSEFNYLYGDLIASMPFGKLCCINDSNGNFTYVKVDTSSSNNAPVLFSSRGDPLEDCGLISPSLFAGSFCGITLPVKDFKRNCSLEDVKAPSGFSCWGSNCYHKECQSQKCVSVLAKTSAEVGMADKCTDDTSCGAAYHMDCEQVKGKSCGTGVCKIVAGAGKDTSVCNGKSSSGKSCTFPC